METSDAFLFSCQHNVKSTTCKVSRVANEGEAKIRRVAVDASEKMKVSNFYDETQNHLTRI